MTEKGFTNRLAKEKSPYLLQHQHNPVDWYPWGEEAFQMAKKEDKPVFLSVGYSTCHWCHVMERESFENKDIAKIMNEHFVNVKVDREERPDIDSTYMAYVQQISGSGGWPMSVWLTPDKLPFFGGTYFPAMDNYGRPGFPTLLKKLYEIYKSHKEDIIDEATDAVAKLSQTSHLIRKGKLDSSESITKNTFMTIGHSFDKQEGGFSPAPKFPRPPIFHFLLRFWKKYHKEEPKALEMAFFTLEKIARGGIHDHLEGGFHRYSVDGKWHIPHYEKMLYDQAQLTVTYLNSHRISDSHGFDQVARKTLQYVKKLLSHPQGGIYSAEDADSFDERTGTKREGAFYVWTYDELSQVLGKDMDLFEFHYAVRPEGNTPIESDPHRELAGTNTLKQVHTLEETARIRNPPLSVEEVARRLESCRELLVNQRNQRARPHLDDKVLTSWNGLMLSGFSIGYQVLRDPEYLNDAVRLARFIRENLYLRESKSLLRSYREGPSDIEGFADDYAYLIRGLLDLYEASGSVEWVQWAVELQETQHKLFWDPKEGGYFNTSKDRAILFQAKEVYDGVEPSVNAVSVQNLGRLSVMLDSSELAEHSQDIFEVFHSHLNNYPQICPELAAGLIFDQDHVQIIVAGPAESGLRNKFVELIHSKFIPNRVMLFADGGEGQAYLSKSNSVMADIPGGTPAVYICHHQTCSAPITDETELLKQLSEL